MIMRMRKLLGRLGGDRRGVSAVEFALLTPVMITFYLGCVEISDGVAVSRKVSLTAASLANLAAQTTTISTTDMTNILNAATAIVAPSDSTKLQITVSCLSIDANKNAKVKWSRANTGSGRTTGSTYTFDSSSSALDVASTQLILAEATYSYTPIVGTAISGTLTLSDRMFMSPRISTPDYNGTTCS